MNPEHSNKDFQWNDSLVNECYRHIRKAFDNPDEYNGGKWEGIDKEIEKFKLTYISKDNLVSGSNVAGNEKDFLFVTEDGKELFNRSEEVFAVDKKRIELFEQHNGKGIGTWINGWYTTNVIPNPKEKDPEVLNEIKKRFALFSTGKKANEYILMNKPILTLNEVLNMASQRGASSAFENHIKQLAQSKIKGEKPNTL